jgi:hypothetical protein
MSPSELSQTPRHLCLPLSRVEDTALDQRLKVLRPHEVVERDTDTRSS